MSFCCVVLPCLAFLSISWIIKIMYMYVSMSFTHVKSNSLNDGNTINQHQCPVIIEKPQDPAGSVHASVQNNRVDILPCLSLKGKFDPKLGYDFLSIVMKYFANFVLYWLVRPFILLFFGLTLTTSVILMFRIQIGLDQNLALPKVSVWYV